MYIRNQVSPPRLAIGAVVLTLDGTVQSSGVQVVVRGDGAAEAAGLGTIAYSAASNVVYYTPTQAETNFVGFVVIAYKTGCLPVSQTVITVSAAVPTATENADALLNRDMSIGTDSGSPTVRTVRQALRFLRNKWTLTGTTLSVKKDDDATESWSGVVTKTAGAEPITGSDPA